MTADATSDPQRGNYLERHARSMPNALALCEGERQLSWAAWDAQANRLAAALAARGIGEGDRVAVRMMNRLEWFVVEAALGKLGALRVAVSYRLRPAEVRYMLEHSAARALVFDDEAPAALAPAFTNLPTLRLKVGLYPRLVQAETAHEQAGAQDVEAWGPLLAASSAEPRFTEKAGGSIVYTSGTTGHPKGVRKTAPADEESRARLRRISEDLRRTIPFQRGDRNLLSAPLNHAAAPASALGTHMRGGTVYLERKFDAESALKVIHEHRITTSFLVPTMLNRIVNLPAAVRARYDVSSMRAITTGASVCPAELKRQVTAYFGPCLYENYGATEVGLVTMWTPADLEQRADSCGRLLDGVDVRIVDDARNPLPRGQLGEIFVKSPATMASYLGESKSADFTDDGYFTAGDVGRLDADGYLYILDRKKDMIIAGGVNIYPAEIEAVLRAHPAVLDAAVFGAPDPEWGEQVVAVVERVPGARLAQTELDAFVVEQLAGYKRPRALTFVNELPRNAAGKVLKHELRAAHWAGTGRSI